MFLIFCEVQPITNNFPGHLQIDSQIGRKLSKNYITKPFPLYLTKGYCFIVIGQANFVFSSFIFFSQEIASSLL